MSAFKSKIAALTLLLAITSGASAQSDGLVVSTQQGDVAGTFSAPSVRQFLGIPYATASRWEAPVLPPTRNGTFNASAFGDSCFQMLTPANVEFIELAWTFGNTDVIFVPESEDCLTVNIWSPSVDRNQSTAVMVWIHGGAQNWGTSRLPIYEGTNLVRDNDDVTIVSFNYRLNIFGQPNAPQLDIQDQTQNFGLLDVDLAVQWIHDNIANFGGDPDRITLFGQSAGAITIDAYAFAHPNDTIVKGLIEQSGNALLYTLSLEDLSGLDPASIPPSRIDSTTWNAAAAAVGCGNTPTAAQFSCMQTVNATSLENVVISNNVAFNLVQDNVTYFQDTPTRAAAGNFLNVPLLIGTTQDEDDSFDVAGELVALGRVIPVLNQVTSDLTTTVVFTCPTSSEISSHLSAGLQVYRYLYEPVFPNLSLRPDLRAFHGSEIPIIFGTYNDSPIAPTPTEIEFSKFIQSVWVGFARDPKQGLTELGWPVYNPQTASLAQLGSPANATGVVFTNSTDVDILCPNTTFLIDTLRGLLTLPSGS